MVKKESHDGKKEAKKGFSHHLLPLFINFSFLFFASFFLIIWPLKKIPDGSYERTKCAGCACGLFLQRPWRIIGSGCV